MNTVTKIKNSKLFKQIQEELRNDCLRFTDGELDQLDNWAENVLQCPSGDMERLQGQIPEQDAEIWFELIDNEIQIICKEVEGS